MENRIKQESERRYPGEYVLAETQREHFVKGALYEQSYQLEKSKKLVEALKVIELKAQDIKDSAEEGWLLYKCEKLEEAIKQALADFEGETNT